MTPKKLLVLSAVITAIYLLLHLCGGRQNVGYLSGTPVGSLFLGCAYAMMHFVFVIVAPILAISSLLMAISERGRS